MIERESIISNYLEAYNQFNIERMVLDFDPNIKFENIGNGEINMTLNGIESFVAQAEKAAALFSSRTQTVREYQHRENETETGIDYHAVLAIDLPNGMKKGEELRMQGRSIFKFSGNKIIELTDIS